MARVNYTTCDGCGKASENSWETGFLKVIIREDRASHLARTIVDGDYCSIACLAKITDNARKLCPDLDASQDRSHPDWRPSDHDAAKESYGCPATPNGDGFGPRCMLELGHPKSTPHIFDTAWPTIKVGDAGEDPGCQGSLCSGCPTCEPIFSDEE